jgi:gamma-glutamylcyclotransferase (GGCT)/AIG2-like uncharacterized protein YtfP
MTDGHQLEFGRVAKGPVVAGDDPRIGEMVRHLRLAGRWMKRAELFAACGFLAGEGTDRTARALAKQSPMILTSTHGYCHVENATVKEFDEAIAEQEARHRRAEEKLQQMYALRHRRVEREKVPSGQWAADSEQKEAVLA